MKNYHKFSNLKQCLCIILRICRSEIQVQCAQPGPLLRVSAGGNQGVSKPPFLSAGPRGESISGLDWWLSSVSWQCRTEAPVSWGLGSASRGWLHYLSCFLCIPPHTSNLFDLHFYLTPFTPMGGSSLLLRDHVISLGSSGLSKILSLFKRLHQVPFAMFTGSRG